MKTTKKLLALLLAAVLALGLGAPASALGLEEDWPAFAITAQTQDMEVPYGESFTLRVELNIPNGLTVGYAWYRELSGNTVTEIGNSDAPALTLSPGSPHYPTSGKPYLAASETYFCRIVDMDKTGNGNVPSAECSFSGHVTVTVLADRGPTLWERTLDVLRDIFVRPFSQAAVISVLPGILSYGVGIIFSPLIYVIVLLPVFFVNLFSVIFTGKGIMPEVV